MPTLRQVARAIRHAPALESLDGLWRAIRPAYERLLDRGGRGAPVHVGRAAWVRMPASFASTDWETFEPETVARVAAWVRANPDGTLLDVGASLGIFTLLTLELSPTSRCIAMDADLTSLALCARLCAASAGDRLLFVHGLLSERHESGATLASATASARAQIAQRPEPAITDLRYTCLDSAGIEGIPVHSLDGLLLSRPTLTDRPLLLKCDIEGAELLALRGAEQLLRARRPELCVSVHPPRLPEFGATADDIRAFLAALEYDTELIAVDHEEHWWCRPREAPVSRSISLATAGEAPAAQSVS